MTSPAPGTRTAPPARGELPSLDHLLAGTDASATVLVDGRRRTSAAVVRWEAAALAGALAARGVGRGDAVAWQLPNWRQSVVLFWACWRLGAVAAPLHHRSGGREVDAQLCALRPRAVLAAPDLPARAVPGAIEVPRDGGYGELLPHPSTTGGVTDPNAPAVVLFTSGSTGEPKGVVHTQRSLGRKARTMPRVHGLSAADAVLMPAPLAHVSGLLNGVLLPAAAGMKAVLMDRWDPAVALELIAAERITFMVGPPTFFLELLGDPSFSPERVASLRVISCGGTGVTAAFVEDASTRLGARVKRSYGSTEAPTVTTWHDGDPVERAATTDGRPVGDVELQIVRPGTDSPLPAGQLGELRVRGSEVGAGYLGQPRPEPSAGTIRAHRPKDDATSAPADGAERGHIPFAPGGWFATGDLAVLDEDGWLTVVGRSGDVIIRGGENVAPEEVEAVLEAHPTVRRALAVGVPDQRLGEVVAAAVVADEALDPDACRDWFAARGVARFKAPTHLLRVDELPVLESGKPDRRAVRQLLLAHRDDA